MIDTEFDFFSDTPIGKDPDSRSPTLRRYHQLLWTKPLPDGTSFTLSDREPRSYLYGTSSKGEFHLSSDAIGHTYRNWKRMASIVSQISDKEMEAFFRVCSTIGAYTIFPAKMIDGKQNINMARGTNSKVRDRIDLTLECIRLLYLEQSNPLDATLLRYNSFFSLFDDFIGFVEFFMFQDLVSSHGNQINFFLPFEGFDGPVLPRDIDEYRTYRLNVMSFVKSRGRRMGGR